MQNNNSLNMVILDDYQNFFEKMNDDNRLPSIINLSIFKKHFEYTSDFKQDNLNEVYKTFYQLAEHKFQIDSPSNIEKFRNIVNISIEWIDVMSSSKSQFQNFLVKTRTVVCGTCVGIARLHYGINENIYDLDEMKAMGFNYYSVGRKTIYSK